MTKPAAHPEPAPAPSPWLLWQLLDSAFPIGSFAHSGGVESAWQHGRLPTPADLLVFTRTAIRQSLHAVVPFLLAAHGDTQPASKLNELLDSMLSNHVANRASRAQAHALLATAEKVFPFPPPSPLTVWRREVLVNDLPIHLPVVLGTLLRLLDVPRTDAVRLHFFMTARTVLSAAVRLGVVGPIQAQQLQTALAPDFDALTAEAAGLTLDDACQTAPLLELLQSTQDRLYSRLFQS